MTTRATTGWTGSLLAAHASLALGCTATVHDPRGIWEGTFTARDGSRASLELLVHDELDYPGLEALESARWTVHGLEGHAEGWFDLVGRLFYCEVGPCRYDPARAPGDMYYEYPHLFPEVPEGGFAVLADPVSYAPGECGYIEMSDVGRVWPLELRTADEGGAPDEVIGVGRIGLGCQGIAPTDYGTFWLAHVE